jgi:hypothetical protein
VKRFTSAKKFNEMPTLPSTRALVNRLADLLAALSVASDRPLSVTPARAAPAAA